MPFGVTATQFVAPFDYIKSRLQLGFYIYSKPHRLFTISWRLIRVFQDDESSDWFDVYPWVNHLYVLFWDFASCCLIHMYYTTISCFHKLNGCVAPSAGLELRPLLWKLKKFEFRAISSMSRSDSIKNKISIWVVTFAVQWQNNKLLFCQGYLSPLDIKIWPLYPTFAGLERRSCFNKLKTTRKNKNRAFSLLILKQVVYQLTRKFLDLLWY